jgi:hypothetical protein
MIRRMLTFSIGAIVVGVLAAALSASAMARSTSEAHITAVGAVPAAVTAGQTISVSFQLVRDSKIIGMLDVYCGAIAGGKPAPLVDKGTDGSVGHCTWSIPRKARGKTFDGFISAQAASGTWYNAGFDVPIH